jgi:lipoprotein NlpD
MIGGCASSGRPDALATYVVRPQDTLYSIAWRHDLDYRDLAKWNNIGPDFRLAIGQVLVLEPRGRHEGRAPVAASPPRQSPDSSATPKTSQPATASRAQDVPRVRDVPRVGKPTPLPNAPAGTTAQRAQGAGSTAAAPGVSAAPDFSAGPNGTAAAPSVATAPNGTATAAPSSDATPSGTTVLGHPATTRAPTPSSASSAAVASSAIGGKSKWVWPTDRLSAPRPVPGGGVLLLGRLGQDVRAAGSGRVVYTGNGLRGYGNLIIIKHGDKLLSSYAHNRELLVHEGQEVAAGQVIGHMGMGPHQVCALYFEIRVNGKPTDPLHYLTSGSR